MSPCYLSEPIRVLSVNNTMGKNLAAGQYFGAVQRRITLQATESKASSAALSASCCGTGHSDGAFVLSEVLHSHAWRVPAHGHVRPYFSFLISGSYREQAAGFSLEYPPFTIVYHSPYFEHADEIGNGGARFFMLEIPESAGGEFERRLPRAGADRMGGRSVWLASALYREFVREDPSEIALQASIAELEAELTRLPDLGEEVTPPWLARVTDRIQCEFRDKLRLEDLAREAGVHPVHLSRTFAQRRGIGLHDYVEGVRVRWVCAEMANGEVDLAALAAEAGYADQSHMTRAFKRVTGMTPGILRATARKNPCLAAHAVPYVPAH